MSEDYFDKFRGIPTPEQFDPKEVHTFMGLALRWAQEVEKGVGVIEVAFELGDPRNLNLQKADSVFDAAFDKTLGRLLHEARKKERVPDQLEQLLRKAHKARNKFIHDFVQDHHDHFLSERGCESMLSELREIISLFIECDRAIQQFVLPLVEKYGVTEEKLTALRKLKYGD